MTGRVPKFLSFVNNSSHSYFVFKKSLHQKREAVKKEGILWVKSLYLYKLPLDTYPGSAANKRWMLLSLQQHNTLPSSVAMRGWVGYNNVHQWVMHHAMLIHHCSIEMFSPSHQSCCKGSIQVTVSFSFSWPCWGGMLWLYYCSSRKNLKLTSSLY